MGPPHALPYARKPLPIWMRHLQTSEVGSEHRPFSAPNEICVTWCVNLLGNSYMISNLSLHSFFSRVFFKTIRPNLKGCSLGSAKGPVSHVCGV